MASFSITGLNKPQLNTNYLLQDDDGEDGLVDQEEARRARAPQDFHEADGAGFPDGALDDPTDDPSGDVE